MRRSFSFVFFLALSALIHWMILFRTDETSTGMASAANEAVTALEAMIIDLTSPVAPPPPRQPEPEPPEEAPSQQQVRPEEPEEDDETETEDYQVARSEETERVDDVPRPEAAAEEPDSPSEEIDSKDSPDGLEDQPEPTRHEDGFAAATGEPPARETAPPEPPKITSRRAHDDFWQSQPTKPIDDEGERLADLAVDPFPSASQWDAIARSVNGRIVAYDLAARDQYLIVDFQSGQHRRRVYRGPEDSPAVGYSTAGFDLRSLAESEKLGRELGVSPDRLVVMMQLRPKVARRLDRKVDLVAESVGWISDDVMTCYGRWRQASFGTWIYEIREIEHRDGRRRSVQDPEAVGIFGRSQ